MNPQLVSQLRDLGRELDEGLITRKGYGVRRREPFKRCFSTSAGAAVPTQGLS